MTNELIYRDECYSIMGACFETIIVEIKAVSALTDEHRAQMLNYLNATGFKLGLLANFGGYPRLEWERLVLTRKKGHS